MIPTPVFVLAALFAGQATTAGSAASPQVPRDVTPTGISRAKAIGAFGLDMVFPCLTHVERGVPIADLPEEFRTDLIPAGDAAVRFPGKDKPTAVWISRYLGSHLQVAEFGPDKCMITADQLPVAETLAKASEVTQRLKPPYTVVPVQPGGYWPVVHRTARTVDGRRVVVDLEGAEPGQPGHLYRFSLLMATITAAPVPASAP